MADHYDRLAKDLLNNREFSMWSKTEHHGFTRG